MRILLTGLGFYALPAILWFIIAKMADKPGLFWGLLIIFGLCFLIPYLQFAQANAIGRRAREKRESADQAAEAEKQARDIAEATRLVLSPDFDIEKSVIPPGRVGGTTRPRKAQTWQDAVGPHIR